MLLGEFHPHISCGSSQMGKILFLPSPTETFSDLRMCGIEVLVGTGIGVNVGMGVKMGVWTVGVRVGVSVAVSGVTVGVRWV